MTHRCPDGIHRQGSPFQNPSKARVMPQKIQPLTPYSVLDPPTDSGIDAKLKALRMELARMLEPSRN